MLEVKFYDTVDDSLLKFAVIISQSNGKWVICKHKERNTWEVPGGHRESNEDIIDTAKRELFEETGAIDFDISPICIYSVTAPDNFDGVETFGKLFFAEIHTFEKELHSEIEKIAIMDELPINWTYPEIQPKLLEEARKRGFLPKKDEIKWLFFDVGSTLVDESKVYEDRMKRIAEISGLTYEQIYKYAMSFYKGNKKGDLEVARQLGVKLPKWESQYERLYTYTKDCLKKLSKIYKIGVIANQSLGTSERLENLGVRKYLDLIIASAEEGVSKPDKSINNQLAALFNYAVRYYDLKDNPCRKAGSIGKSKADDMEFWTKQEFKQFLPSMDKKPEARMAFMLLYGTGMRIGELLALTYEDIDLEKRIISISKSYQRLDGKDVITPSKTPKSNRKITIPPFLAEKLKEYCSHLYGIMPNERMFRFTK